MRSKKFLVYFLSYYALTMNAQTVKTYRGALVSPKNIPMANESFDNAVYNYYDGENSRIWHGAFSLNRSYKSLTTHQSLGYYSIDGRFNHGKPVGTWKWTMQTTYLDAEDFTLTTNYKDGALNGRFSFKSPSFVAKGKALNGYIVDTLYITYCGQKRVTGTNPVKYIPYTYATARLIFDKEGLAHNEWEFIQQQGIKKHFMYYFNHGLLVSQKNYDESTGERTEMYKISEESLQHLATMINNQAVKIERKEDPLLYESGKILKEDGKVYSLACKITHKNFFMMQDPFVSFDMDIEQMAMHSKAIAETAMTSVVCDTISSRIGRMAEKHRLAINASEDRLDSLYAIREKKDKKKRGMGSGILGTVSTIVSTAGKSKIDEAIALERESSVEDRKKAYAYDKAIEHVKMSTNRNELVESLNASEFQNVADVKSLYEALPYYEPQKVNVISKDKEDYALEVTSNYNIINVVYNANEDKVTRITKVSSLEISSESDDENNIYDTVDNMPQFPGGPSALFEYISKNLKYPVVAEENSVQGRVRVSFVVEIDGSITNIKVVKSVDPSLDKEAQRIVRSMPHWIPGKKDGKLVRVKYDVPVNFRLQ